MLAKTMLRKRLQWRFIHIYLALQWLLFILAGKKEEERDKFLLFKFIKILNFGKLNDSLITQACRSNEEDNRNCDGRRPRIRSAHVSHNIPKICSVCHTNN